MHKLIVAIFFSVCCIGCNVKEATKKIDDGYYRRLQEFIIRTDNVGQEYTVTTKLDSATEELSLIYLGAIGRAKNKVLYYTILWGNKDSPHLDTYLAFYDSVGARIGGYYIGSVLEPEISGDDLLFKEFYGSCNQSTAISFRDSIPHDIFIGCTKSADGVYGDVYTFSTD